MANKQLCKLVSILLLVIVFASTTATNNNIDALVAQVQPRVSQVKTFFKRKIDQKCFCVLQAELHLHFEGTVQHKTAYELMK